MLLEEIMETEVITLSEEDTIESAIELMRKSQIRHLPIVDEERHLIGLVSSQDIRDATPSIFRSQSHLEDLQMPLRTIMKTDIIYGHPLDFVEDMAAVFYENKIGCMPVIRDGRLVGIVTETDMLHTFVKLTGAHQPGSHIQIKVINKPGILSDVSAVFKEMKVNIQSALVYPYAKDDSYKVLVLRVKTMNPLSIVSKLKEHGYDVVWPQIPEL
ncbi:MAG: acetoin utilization AcuB family protein [Bacillus sp. (in: firmicutes)]